MRAHERCHVRDCAVKVSIPEAPIFRVNGDMRHLALLLSSLARRFRNRKLNFMCKAHFLPEDLLLTRTGICLSKKAVPCLQVPRRTLELVIRSAISPKHSEVAGALLERSRLVELKNPQESSSDSDCPSDSLSIPQNASAQENSCFPVVDSSMPIPGQDDSTQAFTNTLSLQAMKLNESNLNGDRKNVKRIRDNFISRDDSTNFVDYKRIKMSDSDSPQSQGVSETSNGNSRADDEDDDDEEDEDEEADEDEMNEGAAEKAEDPMTVEDPENEPTSKPVMNEISTEVASIAQEEWTDHSL